MVSAHHQDQFCLACSCLQRFVGCLSRLCCNSTMLLLQFRMWLMPGCLSAKRASPPVQLFCRQVQERQAADESGDDDQQRPRAHASLRLCMR